MRAWMGGTGTGARAFFGTARLSARRGRVRGGAGGLVRRRRRVGRRRGGSGLRLRARRRLGGLRRRRWLELLRGDVVRLQREHGVNGLAVLLVLRQRVLDPRELEVGDRDDALVRGHLREELPDVVVGPGDLDLYGFVGVEVLL